MKEPMVTLLVGALLCCQGCVSDRVANVDSQKTIVQAGQFVDPSPTLNELIHFMGSTPIIVADGSIHFICSDGDLWVKTAMDKKGTERVTQWFTEAKKTESSNQASQAIGAPGAPQPER